MSESARPTAARPVNGLYVSSLRLQNPPSSPKTPQSPVAARPAPPLPEEAPPSAAGAPPGFYRDPAVVSELELLADERSLNRLVTMGFPGDRRTLRVTLSPEGILDDANYDDFSEERSIHNQKQRGGMLGKLRRPKPARPVIITSDEF